MAKTGARVHIYGDYDGAGVQKAKRDISMLDTQAKGFSKSFSSSFMGAGAAIGAAFGVGVIGGNVLQFFKDSTTAALADEKAMRSLEIALQNVGAAHQVAPIERFIDALARQTGVADDQLRPAFQRLVTATGDVGLSQKNLQLAMDISAGTGRDLETVTLALTRAFTGSTTGLSRLGVGLDAALLKSKDMDAITAALSQKFSGQAAAAADTYQGKINQLNIAVDEGKELIGVALLDAVSNISEAFGGTGGMAETIDMTSQSVADFISGFSSSIGKLGKLSSETDKVNKSTTDLDRTYTLLTSGTLGPIINFFQSVTDRGAKARVETEKQANALQKLKGEYIDASGAMIGVVSEQGRLRGALNATTTAVVNQFSAMSLLDQKMQDAGTRRIVMANNDAAAARTVATAVASTGTSSVAAAKDLYTFKEALAQVNSEGLEKLNANLKVAQDEFDGFRDSVAGGLTGQLNFANAVDAAKEGGTGIVDGITGQAAGIVAFGEQLKLLLSTSLSEESFKAVAALSAARGSALATELLGANGATLIAQLNTAVASVSAIGEAVGLQSAEKFKGAGVKTAEDTITGFREYMGKDGLGRKRLMNVMDNLAEAATREVRIDVQVTRSINEVVTRISSGTTSGIPGRALGGPVSANRPYIVGEVGPELFVPSSAGNITPNNALGGSVVNLTVNAGMGTDGAQVGEQIVSALRQYQRRNGALPLTVA